MKDKFSHEESLFPVRKKVFPVKSSPVVPLPALPSCLKSFRMRWLCHRLSLCLRFFPVPSRLPLPAVPPLSPSSPCRSVAFSVARPSVAFFLLAVPFCFFPVPSRFPLPAFPAPCTFFPLPALPSCLKSFRMRWLCHRLSLCLSFLPVYPPHAFPRMCACNINNVPPPLPAPFPRLSVLKNLYFLIFP